MGRAVRGMLQTRRDVESLEWPSIKGFWMLDHEKICAFIFSLTGILGIHGCLVGCSANHWLGDTAGRRPGVLVEKGNLFGYARFEVSSDCEATVKEMRIALSSDGAEGGGSSQEITLRDAKFGQSASAVVREEPAKIDAIARGQMTQVEYARVTWNGVRDLAHEIMPIVGLFSGVFGGMTESAFNATFPGGFSLGKTKVTKPNEASAALADMLLRLKAAEAAAESAVTEPENRGGAVPAGTQPLDTP